MENIDRLRCAVGKFAELVPKMNPPKEFIHTIPEIKDRKKIWSFEWSTAPGVYVFYDADRIQYIGKAMARTGLAARVNKQSGPLEGAWDKFLADPSARVAVYALHERDAMWALSLEYSLIETFDTPFNKRNG